MKTKTADTWTTSIEEMLTKAGLTPKEGKKTGSIVMPAPKHSKSKMRHEINSPIKNTEINN